MASKNVYVLRHGQSTYNAAVQAYFDHGKLDCEVEWKKLNPYDPLKFDAPLTVYGEQQARLANAWMKKELVGMGGVDLVIVSPLTRALQTATLAFEGMDVPFLVTPLLREQRFASCDVGREGRELVPLFPPLAPQLHALPAQWWGSLPHTHMELLNGVPGHAREPIPHFRARLMSLMHLIHSRPERTIVLVGHGVVFYHLLGRWLDNCQLEPWDLGRGMTHCCCDGCKCKCGNPDRGQAHVGVIGAGSVGGGAGSVDIAGEGAGKGGAEGEEDETMDEDGDEDEDEGLRLALEAAAEGAA